MSTIEPPPIYSPLAGQDGKALMPWTIYFNALFTGDLGKDWTPTFTSLTSVGTPSFTGRYYQIGQLCYFRIVVTPATSTTSTAGTTYVSNFPLTMNGDGICFAVTNGTGTSSGHCSSATNRIYTPAWSAITVPLSIIGIVEAN
jgi:hypothetical protein